MLDHNKKKGISEVVGVCSRLLESKWKIKQMNFLNMAKLHIMKMLI